MNTEFLKAAFMHGVQKADAEVGITLKDHLEMLKTAAPWGMLVMPALGAGIGALKAYPGEEGKGALTGAMLGLAGYGLGRGLLSAGKAGISRLGGLFRRGAKAVPAAATPAAAAAAPAAAAAAPAAAEAAAAGSLRSALKGGLIGAGLGAGGYHLLSRPSYPGGFPGGWQMPYQYPMMPQMPYQYPMQQSGQMPDEYQLQQLYQMQQPY